MRSVTPDSNVYVSALLWDGKAERLLEMGLERQVRLFISDAILEETLGVLEEKFELSPKKLQRASRTTMTFLSRDGVNPRTTVALVNPGVGVDDGANSYSYVVGPDAKTFLVNTLVEGPPSPIHVILNWKPPATER